MSKYVIGMDIGGTNLRIGAVDAEGNLEKFRKLSVGTAIKGEDIIGDLARFIEKYMKNMEVEGICIGFPATLDKSRKVVLQAPNIPHMENLPVADKLFEMLGLPVLIERDVNLCMFHDMRRYDIAPEGIACGVYFGTGVGNAIFIDGKPYVGRHGAAGELGHIPAYGSFESCGCGNLGCMENIAGGKYLLGRYYDEWADEPLDEVFDNHFTDLQPYVDAMAQTVAAEMNILDPDHLIIGGGVVNLPHFPKVYFVKKLFEHCRKPYPATDLSPIFADESDRKGVLGAAMYFRSKMQP